MGVWTGLGRSWLAVSSRLFPAIGLVLLLLAAGFWAHEWRWSRSAQHATATITEMEARQDAQGEVFYYPHLRFRLPGGEIVQVVSSIGRAADAFSAGEQVPVMYHTADPQQAAIATKAHVYAVAIILGVVGIVLFDFGAVLWIVRRRREMRVSRA